MTRYLEPLRVVAMTGMPLADVLPHSVVVDGKAMVDVDIAEALRATAVANYHEQLSSPPREVRTSAQAGRVFCMVRKNLEPSLERAMEAYR